MTPGRDGSLPVSGDLAKQPAEDPAGNVEADGASRAVPTPVCDFVRSYAASSPARLHMPGHKGAGILGFEALDITEIDGAGELYAGDGVAARSEAVASRLFGCPTFYSAEGSSLALRAMLFLALTGTGAFRRGRPRVLAARNAHRVFLTAAALLDFEPVWLPPRPGDSYHTCTLTPADVASALDALDAPPAAVYLTSPDYLGNVADIAGIAEACHARGVPLLVDSAHGAYLRFLSPSRHPMDLGADLCCASAHKTLPAVTGAAYLHVRRNDLAARAREALALFGSTSPSWLILQSLDALNLRLAGLPGTLSRWLPRLEALRGRLRKTGYRLIGDEPLKLTLDARAYGWTGDALADALRARNVFCEFHDPDFLTLMPTPWNAPADLDRLADGLCALPRRPALSDAAPPFALPKRRLSPRQAMLGPSVVLPVEACEGRVLAAPSVSCPPAVPIVMCGEEIDRAAIRRFRYYGIVRCAVVEEPSDRQ